MKTIPVFFSPEMSVDSHGYSPSASKPEKVVADWNNAGLAIDIRSFVPATANHLSEVHDRDHVVEILEGRKSNGHGNQILEVSQSCLWTVGSFVAATHEAIRNGQVACSPTSGFHHAGYDRCHGFCTFNGLMVAAHTMIANDLAFAIADCDRHFGDGTQDIIERLNLAARVPHWTYGRAVRSGFHWSDFEQQIRHFINDFAEQSVPGGRVLLYQAGADVHVNDPLGPGPTRGMTDDDMRQRDRRIFTLCRDLKIPVVWNLAGGYQKDQHGGISRVLDLHRATMEECVRCSKPTGGRSQQLPQELRNFKSRKAVLEACYAKLHGGRTLKRFIGSVEGDIGGFRDWKAGNRPDHPHMRPDFLPH